MMPVVAETREPNCSLKSSMDMRIDGMLWLFGCVALLPFRQELRLRLRLAPQLVR